MLDILLVDDEPEIRLPLGEALREIGHRVALAADGDEAMHCLERQTFNLVVSDIRLPKGDGFSILRRVRDKQPNTDVILMTAFGTIQEAINSVRETAIEYLTKPSRYPRFWPWSGASTSVGASCTTWLPRAPNWLRATRIQCKPATESKGARPPSYNCGNESPPSPRAPRRFC